MSVPVFVCDDGKPSGITNKEHWRKWEKMTRSSLGRDPPSAMFILRRRVGIDPKLAQCLGILTSSCGHRPGQPIRHRSVTGASTRFQSSPLSWSGDAHREKERKEKETKEERPPSFCRLIAQAEPPFLYDPGSCHYNRQAEWLQVPADHELLSSTSVLTIGSVCARGGRWKRRESLIARFHLFDFAPLALDATRCASSLHSNRPDFVCFVSLQRYARLHGAWSLVERDGLRL